MRGATPKRRALRELCARYGVPLIVNDDIDLAARVGAAGVHLGEHDRTIASARARLGGDAIIGVSCYDSLDARTPARRGGRGLSGVRRVLSLADQARREARNARICCALQSHSACHWWRSAALRRTMHSRCSRPAPTFVAAISGVFGAPDPCCRSAQRYAALFTK